jgi:hypothetical protein
MWQSDQEIHYFRTEPMNKRFQISKRKKREKK